MERGFVRYWRLLDNLWVVVGMRFGVLKVAELVVRLGIVGVGFVWEAEKDSQSVC
jgi:hypothetical protein